MDAGTPFGQSLKQRRKALNLTRTALARQVGCSVATLEKIETGRRRPSLQIAGLLADALRIPDPERPVFLRAARGLPAPSPASPRPPAAAPSRLPVPPTALVGREAELAEIGRLLQSPDCRLLTLAGPGGIGKTRLAIEVAARHQAAFADGAYFAPLAALSAPEFMPSAVAEALRLNFSGPVDPREQLLDMLAKKHALLVLDNLEHLLDGGGLLVEMLQRAPGLKLLAVSRERLGLPPEWVFGVQCLPLPPAGELERVEAYSSVALFVRCARRLRSDFQLRPEDRPWAARICHLAEGAPLAIEMAAAWVRTLSCAEIAAQMERDLDFLSVSARDVPERHRSLQAVFEHSWQLLPEAEQHALRRLALFRGGFTLEAAQAVAGVGLAQIGALVDKSLLRRSADEPVARFDLHELVRQYALAKLEAAGEEQAQAIDRCREFFLALAEAAEAQWLGAGQARWLRRLEAEHDNLRVALRYALDSQAAEAALRLGAALAPFWIVRGYLREGRRWLEQALAIPGEAPRASRAAALQALGRLALEQRELESAETALRTSLALRRELGDLGGMAAVLNSLGSVAWYGGDMRRAGDLYEEVLALRRTQADRLGMANALNNLGLVAMSQREFERAGQLLGESASLYRDVGDQQKLASTLFNLGLVTVRQAQGGAARAAGHFAAGLELARELGYRKIAAYCLNNLAMLAIHRGEAAQAAELAAESLALCREMEDEKGAFYALINLGHAALDQGDLAQADQHVQAALALARKSSLPEELAWLLHVRARLAAARGKLAQALHLAGAAAALCKELPPSAQAHIDAALAEARARLGEAESAAAWQTGAALPQAQAIEAGLAAD